MEKGRQHLLLGTFMCYKSAAKLRGNGQRRAFAARNPRRGTIPWKRKVQRSKNPPCRRRCHAAGKSAEGRCTRFVIGALRKISAPENPKFPAGRASRAARAKLQTVFCREGVSFRAAKPARGNGSERCRGKRRRKLRNLIVSSAMRLF